MSVPLPPPAAFHPRGSGGRVFGLDVLRAAAILGVVGAHALGVFYPHNDYIGLLGHGGFYGVELFFVLSGFLIGQILLQLGASLRHPGTLGAFYVRRWLRTLPLFWLFLAINVGLELRLTGHAPSPGAVATHGFFLANFATQHLTFYSESWSLAVEEWFYLLFPAALWLGLRLCRRFDAVFLTTALGLYTLSTALRLWSAPDPRATWDLWQRMIVLYRFDALMAGVVAAWFAARFPDAWRRHARACLFAGGCLAVGLYLELWRTHGATFVGAPDAFFARTFRFNLLSLAFALLLPFASAWTLAAPSLAGQAVTRIALWSYSMYLVHQPVIRLVGHFVFPTPQSSWLVALASFSLQLGGTVAVSAALFHGYEAPLTRLRETAAPAFARLLDRFRFPPAR